MAGLDMWAPGSGEAGPVDLLAIAAHPDDAELGVGGILALHGRAGVRTGVLDLTRGEMSTNGTPGERLDEARAAALILGLGFRGNLGLPDGALTADHESGLALAAALRVLRPALVLVPDPGDRHPDHRAAAALGERASFLASLGRLDAPGDPIPAPTIGYYPINGLIDAPLVVDVSDVYPLKQQAIRAHASQFDPCGRHPTSLNHPSFLAMIQARDVFFGSRVGTGFGEAVRLRDPLCVTDLQQLTASAARRKG